MTNTTKVAVVFSGRNGLDFIDLRAAVLRIPEVTSRIRQAQGILDQSTAPQADLIALLSGDDDYFFRNIKMKSLAAAVVQVGLFDRYMKTQRRPDYLAGNSNGDSAMLVCAGRMTFDEMVEKAIAIEPVEVKASSENNVVSLPVATEMAPLLSGMSLTEYQAMRAESDGTYSVAKAGVMDLRQLVSSLYHESEVSRFINIGPVRAVRDADYRALGAGDVEAIDSTELDPMLSWFWRQASRSTPTALAQ